MPPSPTISLSSQSRTRYTCEIVFHRATNTPLGDLNTLASDPYIVATLTPVDRTRTAPLRPDTITFRTPTVRKTLNPVFHGARWVVSGVSASGFNLTLALLDEDPGDHDDRLGRAVLRFPPLPNEELKDGWNTGEREYKIHKRHGGVRARIETYFAKAISRGRIGHRARVVLSVRVLGRAPRIPDEDAHKVYTVGPRERFRSSPPLLRAHVRARKQMLKPD